MPLTKKYLHSITLSEWAFFGDYTKKDRPLAYIFSFLWCQKLNECCSEFRYWWLSKVEHTLSGRPGERCYWLFPGCTFRHWRGLPQYHQVSTEVPQPLHALSWGNWWTGWQLTPRSPLPHLQLAAGTAGLTTDSFVLELSGRVLMESCTAEFFFQNCPIT